MSELDLAERVGIEPTVPLPGQQFSRLPDSATLAPLRMVELISRQGRLGADVSPLRLAVEAAYPGEYDFSIGFLLTRRPSTMGDPTGLKGCPVNPDVGESVMAFPSIELIATTGWSSPMEMEERAAHVWGFSRDGSLSFLEQCGSWLSEDERGRAARFIRQEDQLRYVLAHGGIRAVLARYTGLDPSSVTFQMGATGKPTFAETKNNQHRVYFNLSHSHGRMLIAVARNQDVGADLEQIRDTVEVVKLAERFYAPSEHDRVAGVTGLEQAKRFYRYWVAKEAVLKGQAVGLVSLQHCEILDSSYAPRAEVHLLEGGTMQPGWTVHWLECGPEWAGAVSAHGSDWTIRTMTRE